MFITNKIKTIRTNVLIKRKITVHGLCLLIIKSVAVVMNDKIDFHLFYDIDLLLHRGILHFQKIEKRMFHYVYIVSAIGNDCNNSQATIYH